MAYKVKIYENGYTMKSLLQITNSWFRKFVRLEDVSVSPSEKVFLIFASVSCNMYSK